VQIDGNLMQIELFCAELQLFCEAFGTGYNAAMKTLRNSTTPTAVAAFIIIALQDFHKHLGQFGDLLSSKGYPFYAWQFPGRKNRRPDLNTSGSVAEAHGDCNRLRTGSRANLSR
jgi:hypothetical protein